MRTRGWIAIATGAVLLFGAVTWWALESGEVVVLRTRDARGAVHETRVWIASDESGVLWIEAANPERRWYQDLLVRPEVEVVRGGTPERRHAVPLPGPEEHAIVRRLLAQRYGLRDCWIGLLADTSRSVGIRLE
ncbi:MAG TPA: hypothetical protein VKM54_07400 [Myxococcota bacterium]|nr:hypothetical protein [Myxococcota bacterium]